MRREEGEFIEIKRPWPAITPFSLAGGERKNLAEKETATTGDATTEEEGGTVGRRETIVIVMGGAEVAAIIRI